MSFLDRFKPTPRWKHADPAIRAAAVSDLPDTDEHRLVLVELASDPDIRVRRAAVMRITDVAALARLATAEHDPDLRRELTDELVAIAIAPAETEVDGALALGGLEDPKHISTVAKSSPYGAVRAAALGRVLDPKMLSSVARHAADPQTALDASARVTDPAELLNIALKTDHKEAGLSALARTAEALADGFVRETLDNIATRAKNKSVSKRARAMVQAIDDAATAERLAREQWQQRIDSVVLRLDAVAAAPGAPGARGQLAETEAQWRAVSAGSGFDVDADGAARFAGLVESTALAIAAIEREHTARRDAAERAEAVRLTRVSICERLEAVQADDAIESVAVAQAEWEGLPASALQDAEDDRLRARFEQACQRAAARHENRLEIERMHARLVELSLDAERVSQDESADAAWHAFDRERQSLQAKVEAVDPAVATRFAEADARIAGRAEERRAAVERVARQYALRIDQLIERATTRAAAEDLTLREAERLARDLRTAIEAPRESDEREHRGVVDRLKIAQTVVGPKLHELRELDEWKRFANAAVQEELIAKTEALRAKYGFDAPEGVAPENLDKAARELHDIQERWKLAAEAPRAQAQTLWHRYRQAADPVQTKVREFFAVRSEERKANLDRKLAIIERAEALADSTDWIKTAEELKKLQAEWQASGAVPRQDSRATWKRFRDACDAFFTRRNADLAQRKETWSANQAKKEALCARAEQLAASTQWDPAAAEIRRLQADWKTVGPVRRTKSEALWQRFRAACDAFFDRYKRRDQIELEARQADREGLVVELESLVVVGSAEPTSPAPDEAGVVAPPAFRLDNAALLDEVRSLRNRWNMSSPTVRQGADPLSGRFMIALERLTSAYPEAFRGTELDVDANRQKMERLCAKVEGFMTDSAAVPASSSQALATMLREALASNTIGGRAGEESKWRAMAEDVRQAQAAWTRLGPVPGEAGRQLGDRFHRSCSRFFDQFRRHVPQQAAQQSESQLQRGRPVGAR